MVEASSLSCLLLLIKIRACLVYDGGLGEHYFWFGWSVSGHFGSWMRWPLPQVTQSVLRVGGHDTNTGEGHEEKRWVKGILLVWSCWTKRLVPFEYEPRDNDCHHLAWVSPLLSSPLLSLSSRNPSASCSEVHFPPTWLPLHTQQFRVATCLLHQTQSATQDQTNIHHHLQHFATGTWLCGHPDWNSCWLTSSPCLCRDPEMIK